MVADTLPDQPARPGDNAHVNLSFDDVADMKKKFDALAAGGQVTMPLQDTFWGAKFGMLKDAFGVQWMFNCQHRAARRRAAAAARARAPAAASARASRRRRAAPSQRPLPEIPRRLKRPGLRRPGRFSFPPIARW